MCLTITLSMSNTLFMLFLPQIYQTCCEFLPLIRTVFSSLSVWYILTYLCLLNQKLILWELPFETSLLLNSKEKVNNDFILQFEFHPTLFHVNEFEFPKIFCHFEHLPHCKVSLYSGWFDSYIKTCCQRKLDIM